MLYILPLLEGQFIERFKDHMRKHGVKYLAGAGVLGGAALAAHSLSSPAAAVVPVVKHKIHKTPAVAAVVPQESPDRVVLKPYKKYTPDPLTPEEQQAIKDSEERVKTGNTYPRENIDDIIAQKDSEGKREISNPDEIIPALGNDPNDNYLKSTDPLGYQYINFRKMS
jgi:hypothetical protein